MGINNIHITNDAVERTNRLKFMKMKNFIEGMLIITCYIYNYELERVTNIYIVHLQLAQLQETCANESSVLNLSFSNWLIK